MKKQTLINKINAKIRFWKKDRNNYKQPSPKRTQINWTINELKEIKEEVKKLE